MPNLPPLQKIRLSRGIDLAYHTAGDKIQKAILLLHGFPSSSRTFRDLIEPLSRSAFVVAPDLPGFGASTPLPKATFAGFADCIEELLAKLGVEQRFLYLHDFGAPVALHLALRAPQLVSGLIIQNANAHRSGFGPAWNATKKFWTAPNAENEAAATAHLTLEGTRDQYVSGVPADVAAKIDPQVWQEDWRVMSLPGRLETQRSLIADYGKYAEHFEEIAAYLKEHQPPALMLWGRHGAFFDIAEVQSWLEDLPRMEVHILDGGHFLLETHAAVVTQLMLRFMDDATAVPAGRD